MVNVTISLGDDITVTIIAIRGERVRLGINAPHHIPVHRKEVYDAVQHEVQKQVDDNCEA